MTRSLALRGLLRNQTFILFLTLVAFIIIVSSLSSHFLTLSNLLNVLQQIAVVGIITVGMTVVILSGGLDISVGTVISLSASVTAVMIGNGASVAVAVIAGFAIAVVSQVVNGVIISLTKCIPIIITLGTMSIYQGFALLVTGGYTHNLQGAFQFLGRSDVLYIPVPVLVLVAVNILVFLLLKYLKFGRRVYVLGANENAAFVSGINIIGNKILVYTVHGVTAGIGRWSSCPGSGLRLPSWAPGTSFAPLRPPSSAASPSWEARGRFWERSSASSFSASSRTRSTSSMSHRAFKTSPLAS